MPDHTATLCSSFYLHETSEEEVVRLIGNLSEGKAINENDIPTKIIKLTKFVVAPVLTRILISALMKVFILILQIWRTKYLLKLSTNIYFATVQ